MMHLPLSSIRPPSFPALPSHITVISPCRLPPWDASKGLPTASNLGAHITPSNRWAEPQTLSSTPPGKNWREWKRGPSVFPVAVVSVTPRPESPT
jgi:hypothetical protein